MIIRQLGLVSTSSRRGHGSSTSSSCLLVCNGSLFKEVAMFLRGRRRGVGVVQCWEEMGFVIGWEVNGRLVK